MQFSARPVGSVAFWTLGVETFAQARLRLMTPPMKVKLSECLVRAFNGDRASKKSAGILAGRSRLRSGAEYSPSMIASWSILMFASQQNRSQGVHLND